MQSQPTPSYTYDAMGRLVTMAPSGGSNDVVAQHVLLDPRLAGPRSLTASGLLHPTILNAPSLFVPAVSLTNPPVAIIPAVNAAPGGTMIATKRPFLMPDDTANRSV